MKRFDAAGRKRRGGYVKRRGPEARFRPVKATDMAAVRRDTRFPPEIRQFVEFYQAFGGHYLIFERFH
ncbi:hypothetical protein [Burkholderia cepacia]|uniref:hypothetical protein n=1 Tax=Burkholderia cepacia TaxID=292 RepID=UPI000A524D28|nr:hypothetical protein [Burkholderia cepacia]